MKKKIIDLMALFDYNFIKEQPKGRLLFYDPDYEQNVQIWLKPFIKESLNNAVTLIRDRFIEIGRSKGRSDKEAFDKAWNQI